MQSYQQGKYKTNTTTCLKFPYHFTTYLDYISFLKKPGEYFTLQPLTTYLHTHNYTISPSMPQPWHHLSYYTPGLGPGAQGCPGWCTISPPAVSTLANHPPSSLDWRRSPECRPWLGTGLYNWLHGTASSACRSHSPCRVPSPDHAYVLSNEFSCCWHWSHNNVG